MEMNVVLITFDSCRWDSYERADMRFLNQHCPARKAYSQATFTYAAHLAMFQGLLPNTKEALAYYNRYTRQLIRIANRGVGPSSLISFQAGTEDIVTGFRGAGYFTLGLGAMEWFRHPHLTRNFEQFFNIGIHAQNQVDILLDRTKQNRPFFALVNFGETHDPYTIGYEHRVPYSSTSRARQNNLSAGTFDEEGWKKQSLCCQYLDTQVSAIFRHLLATTRETIFIVCGDHGECFGEDGMFGHGFYHPKIMEVPLAIFDFHGELRL